MAKFRVIVQIYKVFNLEAPTAQDAKRLAEEEVKKAGITDKYNVNEAKDLDKAKAKRKAHEEKIKALKAKKKAEEVKPAPAPAQPEPTK